MTTAAAIYECQNPACTLGSRKGPGYFTGGITAAQKAMLTGDPEESFSEGKDFGEGFCPVCGESGTTTGENHEIVEKKGDPHQDLHDKVHARVQDPDDSLTADQAQGVLVALVAARENDGTEVDDES